MKTLLTLAVLCASLQLHAAEWLTDFAKAQAKAKAENKVVFLAAVLDTCPACRGMEKSVFPSKDFEEFAAKNLVLVKTEFGEKKKLTDAQLKNGAALKEKYNLGEGWPTLLVLDSNGKVLKRHLGGFENGTKDLLAFIATAKP